MNGILSSIKKNGLLNSLKIGGDIVSLINKQPFQIHAFGSNYIGPGTHLDLNLEKGLQPISDLDHAAMLHDVAYAEHKNLSERHHADKILENSAKEVPSIEGKIVQGVMYTKRKLGLGIDDKQELIDKMEKFLKENDNNIVKKTAKPKHSLKLENWNFLNIFLKKVEKFKMVYPVEYCSDYDFHKENNTEEYVISLSFSQ